MPIIKYYVIKLYIFIDLLHLFNVSVTVIHAFC